VLFHNDHAFSSRFLRGSQLDLEKRQMPIWAVFRSNIELISACASRKALHKDSGKHRHA
jgi:hypothetical protein